MNWIKRLLRNNNKTELVVFNGMRYEVERQYEEFLNKRVDIISTTITQDFEEYGHTKMYSLLITYKKV